MRPDEYIDSTTHQTSVPPSSANWSWWVQNAARNAGAFSARYALLVFCACHSCPSPDAGAPGRETLRLSAGEISRIPDVGVVDNTVPPPGLAPVPGQRTAWWCRCACSRGSGSRSAPSSSASLVGCDPKLGSGSFHPHTVRSPARADLDIDPPRRLISQESADRARA